MASGSSVRCVITVPHAVSSRSASSPRLVTGGVVVLMLSAVEPKDVREEPQRAIPRKGVLSYSLTLLGRSMKAPMRFRLRLALR